MALLKVGGPSQSYQQEQMPIQQQEEIPVPPHHTAIDTPVGSVVLTDWFGVAAVCIIIIVVGVVKKYFWNSSSKDDEDDD